MKQRIQKAFAVLGMWSLIVAGAAAALVIELLDLLFTGISRLLRRK